MKPRILQLLPLLAAGLCLVRVTSLPLLAANPAPQWQEVELTFTATHDATRSPAEVKFYFGTADQDASLDTTVAYDRGQVGDDPGPLAVGHFNHRTRPGHTDRTFRGVIDEIRVHGSRLDGTGALTLDQIRAVQRATATTWSQAGDENADARTERLRVIITTDFPSIGVVQHAPERTQCTVQP